MGRLSSLTLLQGAEGRGTMPLLARGHPPPALPHRKTRLGTLILTIPPISPSPPPHTHTTIAHAVITSYFHNNILSSHRIFRTRNSSVHKFLQLTSITTNAGNLTTTLPQPSLHPLSLRKYLAELNSYSVKELKDKIAALGDVRTRGKVTQTSQSNIPVNSLSNLFFLVGGTSALLERISWRRRR